MRLAAVATEGHENETDRIADSAPDRGSWNDGSPRQVRLPRVSLPPELPHQLALRQNMPLNRPQQLLFGRRVQGYPFIKRI